MPSYGRIDAEYAGHLAGCPPEDDGPILMVNFMKYHQRAVYADGSDRGLTGKEADDAYSPVDVLAKIGAVPVFFADVEPGGAWDRVAIVRYPTRRSFVEMQSRKDFQAKHTHKAAGMEHTIVCGCLPIGRPPLGSGTRVIFEMAAPGVTLRLERAGELRVEGTIVGDGRRFATMAIAWGDESLVAPTASAERVVAATRPRIDRLAGELAQIALASADTWSTGSVPT